MDPASLFHNSFSIGQLVSAGVLFGCAHGFLSAERVHAVGLSKLERSRDGRPGTRPLDLPLLREALWPSIGFDRPKNVPWGDLVFLITGGVSAYALGIASGSVFGDLYGLMLGLSAAKAASWEVLMLRTGIHLRAHAGHGAPESCGERWAYGRSMG